MKNNIKKIILPTIIISLFLVGFKSYANANNFRFVKIIHNGIMCEYTNNESGMDYIVFHDYDDGLEIYPDLDE